MKDILNFKDFMNKTINESKLEKFNWKTNKNGMVYNDDVIKNGMYISIKQTEDGFDLYLDANDEYHMFEKDFNYRKYGEFNKGKDFSDDYYESFGLQKVSLEDAVDMFENWLGLEFPKDMFELKESKVTTKIYQNMADSDLIKNQSALNSLFYDRYNKLYDERIYENEENGKYFKLLHALNTKISLVEKFKGRNGFNDYKVIESNAPFGKLDSLKMRKEGFSLVGIEIFGIKDTLKPIDDYIEDIKNSFDYKSFISDNNTK